MICEPCAQGAKKNRKLEDKGKPQKRGKHHPKNCGCTCQHRSGTWEKLFSVERPNA
jgi:hypothetical protein